MKKKILAFLMAACVAATSVPMDGAVYAAEVRMEQEAESTEQETETVVTTGETAEKTEASETTETSENTEVTETETADVTESTEAAETTEATETTETTETTEATESTEVTEATETTESTETEVTENTESTESTEESVSLPLNYILVGAAEVDVPGTQQIVASIGEENTEVTNVVLTYQNQTTGESYQTKAADAVDDLKLFTITFTGEAQKGTYALTGISYETKEGKGEIDFAGLDMSVAFGVGESVETNPDQLISEEDPSLSADDLDIDVITMDEKGNVLSENVSEDGLALAQNLKLSSDGKKVIVLDPGHDDTHTGAHQNGAAEETLVLQIAQYCKEELETYAGVTVYMTRSSGSCPNGGSSVTSGTCNEKRVAFAQSVGADAYISFHLNSNVSSSPSGVGVYYPNSNYNATIGQVGQGIAQKIYEKLRALGLSAWGTGTMIWNASEDKYDDGSAADYLGVIRNCKKVGIPAVLIEHAFISSNSDYSNFLSSADKLKALGVADATAVAEYYGLQKGGNLAISYVQSLPGGKLKVGWEALDNVSYYQVWRSTKKDSGYKKQAEVTGTEYTDSGVKIGKTYYYKLIAIMSNGQQGQTSDAMTGFALDQTTISYAKSYASKKIEVAWESVPDSEGYLVFRSENGSDFTQVAKITSGGTLSYIDKVKKNNKAYTYKVQAYNTSGKMQGTGEFSDTKTARSVAKTTITDFATVNATSLSVSWKKVGGASGYEIYRSTGKNGKYKKIATVKSGKTTTYTDKKVKFGVPYYYKIQTLNQSDGVTGYSGYSAVKSGKTTLTTKITSVVSRDSNTLEIKWNKIDEAYGYRILRSTSKKGSYKEIKTIKKPGTVKYQDKKAEAGKTYYYKVEILVKSGKKILENGVSKAVSGKTLKQVSITSVTANGTAMLLKWKKVSGADGYEIFRSTKKKGTYEKIGTVTGAKKTKYEDKTVSNGKTYYYKVRAYHKKKKLTETGSFSKIQKTYTLKKVVITSAAANGQKVELAWEKAAKGTGYSIYRSENKDGKFEQIGTTSSLKKVKYTDSNVEFGKVYYYKVAVNYSMSGKDESVGGYSDVAMVPMMDGGHMVMGTSAVTVEQMVAYYNARYTFPSDTYKDKGAETAEAFFTIVKEEAEAEGVRADLLFAQVILETGGLQFGGDVSASQCNFGGLGAVGGGAAGETFADVRTGLRAQVQHLKAYASTDALVNPCADSRFNYVTRGCAPYIEWLAIPKNPYGKGWAADPDYGTKLLQIMESL